MGYVNGNLNLTVSADLSGVADKPTQDEILGLLQDADGDKLMLIKNILSSQNDSFVALVSTINAMQSDLNTVKNNITESGIDIDSAQNIKDALTNAGIAVGDNATLQEIIASLDKSIVNPQDLRNALSALGVSVSASDTIPQLVAKMASIVTLASGSQDANATASQILSGYSAYVKGTKVNGSVPSLGAQTITPGTTAKTIPAGRYLSGLQTIAGDGNLVPANIKNGVSIFGIAGNYGGDAKTGSLELSFDYASYSNSIEIKVQTVQLGFTPSVVLIYSYLADVLAAMIYIKDRGKNGFNYYHSTGYKLASTDTKNRFNIKGSALVISGYDVCAISVPSNTTLEDRMAGYIALP